MKQTSIKLSKYLSNHQNFLKMIVYFSCFLGLFIAAVTFFDPDFPWHIQYASDVVKSGVPHLDTYSYTMPSFPYVDHSLLSSMVFLFLYRLGGYVLVSVVIAAVGTLGAALIASNVLWLIPVISSTYFSGFGVRAHVFSFLLTAILFKYTKFFFKTKKNQFLFLPLLMCIWANTHGGFSLGIIYLWGYLVIDIFILERTQTNLSQKLASMLAIQFATLATLITPYGIGTWQEAARTILSSDLRKYIIEWQPISSLPSFGILLILLMFSLSVYFMRKIRFQEIFTLYLFIQGILSIRFLPLFAISAAPTIVTAFNTYLKQNEKRLDKKRLSTVISVLTFITIIIFAVEGILQFRFRTLVMKDFYPSEQSVQLVSSLKSEGKIFTMAGWGSYLHWKQPEIKSFIDGRMYVWDQKPHSNELTSAFKTYEGIMDGSIPYKSTFDEFCIGTILWHTADTKSLWYSPEVWSKFINQITTDGWEKKYEDTVSVVYQRKVPLECVIK